MDNPERCNLCGKVDASLLYANHKNLGGIWVCQECWVKSFADNCLVSGSGSSGGGCCG